MVNIDLGEIRKYNNSLKEYQDKSAQIKAEIDFNTVELNRLCTELSGELGVNITPENIESVYSDYANKIKNTLSTGTEILQRIANDEAAIASEQRVNTVETVGVVDGRPQEPTITFNSFGDTTADQAVLNNLPRMF